MQGDAQANDIPAVLCSTSGLGVLPAPAVGVLMNCLAGFCVISTADLLPPVIAEEHYKFA